MPHRVVRASADELITWVGAGTPGTFATSRGIRGREHLSRAERNLAALRSCLYHVVEIPSSVSALNFFVEGSWARTSLGWDAEGTFLGWYVNFELPPKVIPDGLETIDLVLDAVVNPAGGWQWKDRADFDGAVAEGLLDSALPGNSCGSGGRGPGTAGAAPGTVLRTLDRLDAPTFLVRSRIARAVRSRWRLGGTTLTD